MTESCPYCEARIESRGTFLNEATLAACQNCMNPVIETRKDNTTHFLALPDTTDIRLMAPPRSVGGRAIESAKRNLDWLPILPEVGHEVLQVLKRPETGLDEITGLAAKDAAMSAKILQAANGVRFGGLKSVTSLKAACTRLGLRTTANIMQTIVNARLFTKRNEALNARVRHIWKHSLVSATAAFEIAKITSEPNPEMFYMAALFHDIGHVALLEQIYADPDLQELRRSEVLMEEILQEFSSLVGLHAIYNWGLPPAFGVSVYFTTRPERAPIEDWMRMAHIATMAHHIANVLGYPAAPNSPVTSTLVGLPSASFLNLSDIKIANIRVDLEDLLHELFDVAVPEAVEPGA